MDSDRNPIRIEARHRGRRLERLKGRGRELSMQRVGSFRARRVAGSDAAFIVVPRLEA
jgi:hypothetical protein